MYNNSQQDKGSIINTSFKNQDMGGGCDDPPGTCKEVNNGVGLTANAFAAGGVFLLYLDDEISKIKYDQGYRKGLDGNYRLKGRNLNLFKDIDMTAKTRPYTGFGQPGRILSGTGTVISLVSVGYDFRQHSLGRITTGRLAFNSTSTAASLGTVLLAGSGWGLVVAGVGITLDMGYQKFQEIRTSWSIQLGNYESQMRKGFLPGGLSY